MQSNQVFKNIESFALQSEKAEKVLLLLSLSLQICLTTIYTYTQTKFSISCLQRGGIVKCSLTLNFSFRSCLRWYFLETNEQEIKSIGCLLKPEFVLVPIEHFENISFALLRCTTIETSDRKHKTVIEGVFVSANSDIRFRLFSLISNLIYTSTLLVNQRRIQSRKRCRVLTCTSQHFLP